MAAEFSTLTLAADSRLKAYYKLENVNDSSGGGFTLTNNNTVTFVAGKFSNGASFTRASSMSLSTTSDLGIGGGAITMCGWVNPTSLPSADSGDEGQGQANSFSLITHGDAGTNVKYGILLIRESSVQYVGFVRTKENSAQQSVLYAITLPTGSFTHVGMTYDTTNIIGYINGAAVGSTAASGSGSGGTSDYTQIGAGQNNSSAITSFFNGIVDDVPIFNAAITSDEMSYIYTGTVASGSALFTGVAF